MALNNRIQALIDAEIARIDAVDPPPDSFCPITRPRKPADNKRRRYFGGSQLGGNCRRQRWYGFHWSAQEKFDPRMLRLFNRGHREEERFVQYLRMIGVEVQEYDPETISRLWYHPKSESYEILPNSVHGGIEQEDVSGTFHEWIACSRGVEIPEPRQFSFEDMNGHHKGNCDGRARFIPDQNLWGLKLDDWVLLEFKTHKESSFNELLNKNVYQAKPDHWKQMQRYMEKIGFALGLYGAVCKNTDRMYWEFIPFEPSWTVQAEAIAHEAIYSEKAPPRLSSSPSYYECRWCTHRPQCHYNAPMEKNCRTCKDSFPATNGDWACHRWQKKIPRYAEEVGCDFHVPRTD